VPILMLTAKVEEVDKIVTMGCGVQKVCPASFVETQDWELEDPEGKTLEEVRRIRDEIKAKVADLLKEMKHSEG